jgi:DnaJ-class molecular chaperone
MNKASQYGASHYAFKQAQKKNMEKLTQWINANTIKSRMCDECSGTGDGGFFSNYCESCSGSGFILTVICPKCGGYGKGIIFNCELCDGSGKINDWQVLRSYFNIV